MSRIPRWFEAEGGDLQSGVWRHSEQSSQLLIGKKKKENNFQKEQERICLT